ncbi:MAG: hypothetical protein Crog4KO_13520 [Crocinitomicaceae bacterium]
MGNEEVKNLLMSLIKSETEGEVESILTKVGLWNNKKAWRDYGDQDNNSGTMGAQQSRPETALVEKIINSVDSVLTAECIKYGDDPKGENAPRDIRSAVEKYFDIPTGMLSNVTPTERTKMAQRIGLVATGYTAKKGDACYSIFDLGEGQAPSRMPDTFLSLNKKNKVDIPFVQGKYNMGSTGALRFCGKKRIQLILTKRNPEVIKDSDPMDSNLWGFTVVKRIPPPTDHANPQFVYLVKPINNDPGDNEVYSFESESLNILPGSYPNPYENPMSFGSYIKLFEYQMTGLKTNLTLDPYNRLSLLMPSLALPIRLYERRTGYKANSAESTLNGLSVRLEEDKRNNLESESWPTSHSITVLGEDMRVKVYAFKKDLEGNKKPTAKYAKDEGVIFTVNGQTHGHFSKRFFHRKNIALGKLSDSLIVTIDCTEVSAEMRADLFMTSRDRLVDSGDLRDNIIKELSLLLRKHEGLKELKNKRHMEEIENKLDDSKPLVDVVQNIMKNSPSLSTLFLPGAKIRNPFKMGGGGSVVAEFKGLRFPTYFTLTKNWDAEKPKLCPINQTTFRVQFKTDVVNDYFDRETDKGVHRLLANGVSFEGNSSLNPWNGTVTLNIQLLPEWKVGDTIKFKSEVSDVQHFEPFVNEFSILISEPAIVKPGGGGKRKPTTKKKDDGKEDSSDSLALPIIVPVHKNDDNWIRKDFTDQTALVVENNGEEIGNTFFINMHNIFLLTEQKQNSKIDPALLAAQFKYANVLTGLSILKADADKLLPESEEMDVYEFIDFATQSNSRVLLPMISSLSALTVDEIDD